MDAADAQPRLIPAVPLGPWYATAVGTVAILLLFTHAVRYFFVAGLSPLDPVLMMVGTVGCAVPLLLVPTHYRVLRNSPLLLWSLAFSALTIVAYFLSSGDDVAQKELVRRLLSTVLLCSLLLLFADTRCHTVLRRVVVFATLVACALNCIDIVRPLTFSPIVGRAAGLYVNPNIAGSALVVGMLIGVDGVKRSWRAPFVLVVCVAVLATLSRAALACAFVAIVGLVLSERVALRQLIAATLGLALFLLLALVVSGQVSVVIDAVSLLASPDLQRLTITSEVDVGGESSLNTRVEVVRRAWAIFAERPLLGGGLGSTSQLLLGQGSHNIYLRDVAEYGVLGLLVTPTFVLATCWGALRDRRLNAVAFGVVLLLWGISSHDMLDEWQFLVGAAIFAAMGMERVPSGRATEAVG